MLEAIKLRKRYGEIVAVDQISFRVERGLWPFKNVTLIKGHATNSWPAAYSLKPGGRNPAVTPAQSLRLGSVLLAVSALGISGATVAMLSRVPDVSTAMGRHLWAGALANLSLS